MRAGGTIVSRFLFVQMIRRVKRTSLFASAMLTAGAAILLIAFPMPVSFAVLTMALAGLGLGLAQVCSLTTLLTLVSSAMHGTTLSLRFSANRLALLVIPFCSSLAIGTVGTGGIFAATEFALALSALGLRGQAAALKG